MSPQFTKHPLALAAVAAAATSAVAIAASSAFAGAPSAPTGRYVAGDFHNHSTCSDGSLSVQKKVQKSTAVWGLDWFVQAGHGGSGSRNCTLTEDPSLATPGYPFTNQGPTTTWANSGITPVGNPGGANMWRWQALQQFQYPLLENLSA